MDTPLAPRRSRSGTDALAVGGARPSAGAVCLPVVAVLLLWLALVEVVVVAGWALNLPAVRYAIGIASAILGMAAVGALGWPRGLRVLGSSVLLVVGAALLAMQSQDFSADGQSYHQEAILGIASGWNPLRSPVYPGPYTLWISHYAKGPWLLGAAALASTGSIEIGKGVLYLLMVAAGLTGYALAAACGCRSRWLRGLFGALLAFNPVVCYQIQTYYVDGQMGLLLSLLALLAALACLQPGRSARVALAAACVLVLNAKLSALPMGIVLLSAAAAGLWLLRRRAEFRLLFPAVLAGSLVGLAVGIHPYVTNLVDKGHPFYPLAGASSVDILTGHVSAEFLARNRFEKLAMSLGSASESRQADDAGGDAGQFRWKLPFAVFPSEIRAIYKSTDLRVGGFGPWTSGLLLLVVLQWIALWARGWRPAGPQRTVLVFLGALLVSVLVMPEAWWARYAPQAWTLWIVLIFLPLLQKHSAMTRLGWLAVAAASINVVLVIVPALAHRVVSEMDWRAQAGSLGRIGRQAELRVTIAENSTRYRLQQRGIRFSESADAGCSGLADNLIGTASSVCIPRDAVRDYQRGSPWIARVLGRSL